MNFEVFNYYNTTVPLFTPKTSSQLLNLSTSKLNS